MKVIPRNEAKAAGLKFYFTGKPCVYGHDSERYVSTRTCAACQLMHCQAARAKDPEATKKKRRESIARNPEPHRQAFKRWREKNAEADSSRNREWRESNPQKQRAKEMRRRAARLQATPTWYGELDEFVMLEAADLCRLRELATGIPWQVDHMVPLKARSACGLHCASNVQVIPAALNASKQNRMILMEPFEWLRNSATK